MIAEYVNGAGANSPSAEYIYTGSQLLATLAGTTTTYHHPDHLSNRAETDSSGNLTRAYGHFPFGETWYETGTADKWKFTGYERDLMSGETGLDYAQFRYNGSGLGRFMTADLLSGYLNNPQSVNRYGYVTNDPINLVDPHGLNIFGAFWRWFTGEGDGAPPNMGGGNPGNIVNTIQQNPPDETASNDKTPPNPCTVAGQAPPPSVYEKKGKEGSTNLFKDLYNLSQFRRGGDLDAQKFGAAPAYANYAFGVYESAAGDTLDQALALADIYAEYRSTYPASTPMAGPNYPFTPKVNVTNITNGFNAQQGGYLCGR